MVGHVQIADVPGRHEPGTGDLDWSRLLADLTAAGYRGPLGLEYWPTTDSLTSTDLIRSLIDSREEHR